MGFLRPPFNDVCGNDPFCRASTFISRILLLMAATFTIFIVLLSLATRLFVSRRQGRRLATWDSASALLASLTGLVAAALAIYLASAFNSRTLHTVINNVSQLLATVGTALAEISIYLLLLRQSRDSKRGTSCLHTLIFALCVANLSFSIWPLLACRPLAEPSSHSCIAPSRQLACIWTQAGLSAFTFVLLAVATRLRRSAQPVDKASPLWRCAIFYVSCLFAAVLSLVKAAYLANYVATYQAEKGHDVYPSHPLSVRGHLIANAFSLLIFSNAFVAANCLTVCQAPAESGAPEAKEFDASPHHQVDGPASYPPSAGSNRPDSILIIQGPRVPGYQEPVAPVEQDARKPDEVYLGWGSARMVSEHGAWSDSSEDSRTSPPAAGILKTVSVDVVVDVQAEDQWHDAQKEQDPRDWEAVLRQGPK